MVRAKITRLINSKLEGQHFHYNDFNIAISEVTFKTKILIKYEYDPQYFLEIEIPNDKSTFTKTQSGVLGQTTTVEILDYQIEGKMCPGTLAFKEEFKYRGTTGTENLAAHWIVAPEVTKEETAHFILRVTDKGTPSLSRYKRVIVTILPN